MRLIRRSLLFVGALAVAAGPLLAAPADSVRVRVNGYRDLGAAFKAVNDGLRGDVQYIEVQQQARMIRNASRDQYGWFPAGSGPQAGIKTAAKSAIWTNAAQFRAAQDAFTRQAEAFQRAANSRNDKVIRLEVRKLASTCKVCHDSFRTPSN